MSKWINKDLFSEYVKEKEEDAQSSAQTDSNRMACVWRNPDRGSENSPNIYEGRLVPDPVGKFTRKYYYHMFRSGEKWIFVLCQKTFDFSDWCPFCSITQKLYKGSDSDKFMASQYKRKQKHVTNFYIVDDPRDEKIEDVNNRSMGKVKIYEFPDKVESKITQEIFDKKHGAGVSIFDPGEEGYNFIIKVKSTKADKDKRVFPDYSDSTFARTPSSLGTDSEIKALMETTTNLDNYLKGQLKSDADVIEILKGEMLWEMVDDEWARYKGVKTNEVTAPAESSDTPPDNVKDDDVGEFSDNTTDNTTDNAPTPHEDIETVMTPEDQEDADILSELEML